MTYCDLHLHSTASDGTDAPSQLPVLAKARGLAAIAITDHDTLAGHDACRAAAEENQIAFIPGIELSIDPGQPRGTFHLLGYFINDQSKALNSIIDQLTQSRLSRNPRIIEKLNQQGIDITEAEVLDLAGEATIGRPHIAAVLVDNGHADSISDAFSKYLGARGSAYTRRDKIQPEEAIPAVQDAGGLAVLAHPIQLKLDPHALEHKIKQLKEMGLDGLEVMHPDHSPDDTLTYQRLAEKYDLIPTGGSDYHGTRKTIKMGSQNVPLAIYERLTHIHAK